jgi:uncharacterized protein (DUF1501 family)
MLRLEGTRAITSCDGITRRDFLKVGTVAAGAVGLSLADLARLQHAVAAETSTDTNCILLFLVGGPSQLDTWDLKPNAPEHVRGPFQPIRTNVPGVDICEHFPLMAQQANRFTIVRSVHHQEAPIHETGHQLLQTGRLARGGLEHPHYGAVLSHLRGPRVHGVPAFVVLPSPVGNTGVSVGHGQTAGYLGTEHEPFWAMQEMVVSGVDLADLDSSASLVDAVDKAQRSFEETAEFREFDQTDAAVLSTLFNQQAKRAFAIDKESPGLRSRYGSSTFGQSCLLARRLVEHGVRLVTVNMFETVFNQMTWDCHADGGALATTLDDYREILCPMFDRAYSALLDDLSQRGMLSNTLVIAMGEFGRTPHLNPRGGRDHWPGCWSILFAGAGVRGGRVIGESDRIGAEPKHRPVTPAQVAASVYQALGIDLNTKLAGPQGQQIPLVDGAPIHELFSA